MKGYLLDSHTLLWYFEGSTELPTAAQIIIFDISNEIFVSMASLWEIGIKYSLGKLHLPRPFIDLENSVLNEGFYILPVQFDELKVIAGQLPFHHKDPFDRLLIAQSITYGLPIIGRDDVFDAYGVQRFWTSFAER